MTDERRQLALQIATDLIEELTAELEQVKRERDAAVRDLREQNACAHCKHYQPGNLAANCEHECMFISGSKTGWQWRGVCEENGGANDVRTEAQK